jgi:hypothetical protein
MWLVTQMRISEVKATVRDLKSELQYLVVGSNFRSWCVFAENRYLLFV